MTARRVTSLLRLAFLWLGLGLAMAACQRPTVDATAQQAITFAILPAEGRASAEPLWAPLLEDLSQAIGAPVTPYFGASYADLVDAFGQDRAQVGWFSAQPAVQAIDTADAELVARTVSDTGGDSYRATVIVRKGSGLTLQDLLTCGQRHSFGMGDAQSTSGRLAPMAFLFNPRGIDPQRCFTSLVVDDHQANAFAVASGTLDAATSNDVSLAALRERNAQIADQVEEIWRSPEIPEGAILMAEGLDPVLKEKIRSFFLTYGQGEGPVARRQQAVLQGLRYSRFNSAEASYLDPIREIMADQALEQARQSGDRNAARKAEQDLRRLRAAREVQP